MKPFKGELHHWIITDFSKSNPKDCYDNLGFLVYGYNKDRKTLIRTSPVVFFNEFTNEIETLNSRYLLIGEGKTEFS